MADKARLSFACSALHQADLGYGNTWWSCPEENQGYKKLVLQPGKLHQILPWLRRHQPRQQQPDAFTALEVHMLGHEAEEGNEFARLAAHLWPNITTLCVTNFDRGFMAVDAFLGVRTLHLTMFPVKRLTVSSTMLPPHLETLAIHGATQGRRASVLFAPLPHTLRDLTLSHVILHPLSIHSFKRIDSLALLGRVSLNGPADAGVRAAWAALRLGTLHVMLCQGNINITQLLGFPPVTDELRIDVYYGRAFLLPPDVRAMLHTLQALHIKFLLPSQYFAHSLLFSDTLTIDGTPFPNLKLAISYT